MAAALLRRLAPRSGSAPSLIRGALVAHAWRGNARELANTLERALILSEGGPIERRHLSFDAVAGVSPTARLANRPLSELEREAILATLESVNGNRRFAAEHLGIGLRTLYDRLKRYGME